MRIKEVVEASFLERFQLKILLQEVLDHRHMKLLGSFLIPYA